MLGPFTAQVPTPLGFAFIKARSQKESDTFPFFQFNIGDGIITQDEGVSLKDFIPVLLENTEKDIILKLFLLNIMTSSMLMSDFISAMTTNAEMQNNHTIICRVNYLKKT